MGGEASVNKGSSKSESNDNLDISILYSGNDDSVFLTGFNLTELSKAITEFPSFCKGKPNTYILWPYEKCQSFLNVKTEIDLDLLERERAIYFESLNEKKLTSV